MTPYRELVIQATTLVRTHRRPAETRLAECRRWPDDGPVTAIEALEFLQPSPLVNRCRGARRVRGRPAPAASGSLLDGGPSRLMDSRPGPAEVREEGHHGADPGRARPWQLGRGVCQDFAHLFLGACRGLGLPARYVSGYINAPRRDRHPRLVPGLGRAASAGSTSTRPTARSSPTTTS